MICTYQYLIVYNYTFTILPIFWGKFYQSSLCLIQKLAADISLCVQNINSLVAVKKLNKNQIFLLYSCIHYYSNRNLIYILIWLVLLLRLFAIFMLFFNYILIHVKRVQADLMPQVLSTSRPQSAAEIMKQVYFMA